MQAVVLAGGLGTRLRPLTLTRPKALIPVLNRPLVLRAIDLLPPEVDEVLVAVGHLGGMVRDFFERAGGGGRRGVEVIVEREPLGTGGALKNLEPRIRGTFIAINGDVICSLDIGEMLRHHRERRGLGTIALREVEDPGPFGMVLTDDAGRVLRFVEKPGAGEILSRTVNAGCYVLEPEILRLMEGVREISLEREVFPRALERGIYGFRFGGKWFDAGTLDSYLCAHAELMMGVALGEGLERGGEVGWRAPVLVGRGCFVGGGSTIGPGVCLGDGARIGRGCTLAGAVLHEGAIVGDGASLERCVIGRSARVRAGARLTGRIIGDGEEAG